MRWEKRGELERNIQERCGQGQVMEAREGVLVGYGPEIMRLMASVLHDYERSRAAFELFSERLLRELPAFRWECSFRTWAYRLAREACYQVMHAPSGGKQAAGVPAPLDEVPRPRVASRPWQRTSVEERFRALRESLAPQERMLLLLRVDQRLTWPEMARVMFDGDGPLTEDALERKAVDLRQQFQHIKSHLRTLAMEEGLIAGGQATSH
jgi:RNA polymerase sigma-70 factor (ECF subfamily)